jgi:hypothetical protein
LLQSTSSRFFWFILASRAASDPHGEEAHLRRPNHEGLALILRDAAKRPLLQQ